MSNDLSSVFGLMQVLHSGKQARMQRNRDIMNTPDDYPSAVEPFDIPELQTHYAKLRRVNGHIMERQRSASGPCFCGSGKKLKNCHKSFHNGQFMALVYDINSITCLRL